jgi:hypothetical protein
MLMECVFLSMTMFLQGLSIVLEIGEYIVLGGELGSFLQMCSVGELDIKLIEGKKPEEDRCDHGRNRSLCGNVCPPNKRQDETKYLQEGYSQPCLE